jgi:hypothetical protein
MLVTSSLAIGMVLNQTSFGHDITCVEDKVVDLSRLFSQA